MRYRSELLYLFFRKGTTPWFLSTMAKPRTHAVAYLRTSSAANAGADKDSGKRQRAAIATYAKAAGYIIAEEFYDAAVSGAEPVDARPGFVALLEWVKTNGVRTIIVETASRFARDAIVQETGLQSLRRQQIEIIAADSPGAFVDEGPTSDLVRIILGAVAQFDKAMTVAKLKGARERKRRAAGKCEGRKSHAECRPAAVALAKQLRGRGRSLVAIARELEGAGHLNERGRRFNHKSIRTML